jgi:hypothetical protein
MHVESLWPRKMKRGDRSGAETRNVDDFRGDMRRPARTNRKSVINGAEIKQKINRMQHIKAQD